MSDNYEFNIAAMETEMDDLAHFIVQMYKENRDSFLDYEANKDAIMAGLVERVVELYSNE